MAVAFFLIWVDLIEVMVPFPRPPQHRVAEWSHIVRLNSNLVNAKLASVHSGRIDGNPCRRVVHDTTEAMVWQ
jgi:hypothetical protein